MHASKTVFIVGAGASNEVGIPFGRGFLEIISQKLNFKFKGPSLDTDSGDDDILDVIQSQYASDRATLNKYLNAAQRLRDGIPFTRSIDAFIDVHRDDLLIQQLGKLAIAKTILEQERLCSLHVAPPGSAFKDAAKLNQTWYVNLARGLNEGVRPEAIGKSFERLSFIVFNYDRCLEHFLHWGLQKHFGMDSGLAAEAMEHLTILHPYGKISNLPWQKGDAAVPFGFNANRANLLLTSKSIKTYTEQVEDNDLLKRIRQEISAAEVLVFLGFSYLPLNMDILDPGPRCDVQRVFGTALGISNSDIEHIQLGVKTLVHKDLHGFINNTLTCAGLLQEYSRSLFS